MKTICIYHGNCFDGMGAAWVVKKLIPDAMLVPMLYGDKLTWLFQGQIQGEYSKEDQLFIVDFSFKRTIMESLHELFPRMIVLDHHKTAEEDCKGLDFCIFDMKESGASLTWKYFYRGVRTPQMIDYLRDRDLWLHELPSTEFVNAFIQSHPMTFEAYEDVNYLIKNAFFDTVSQGKAIQRYKMQQVSNICDNAAFDKEGIPWVNTSLLFSEVCAELNRRFPSAPYAGYYFERLKDNRRQYGVRSIGDFDVSEVAKKNGGGGHKNAAGWEISLSEF